MIKVLSEAGVDLIAIDPVFAVREDPRQDQPLATAIHQATKAILASVISRENTTTPHELFRQYDVGEDFINLFPDENGIVRKIPSARMMLLYPDQYQFDFPFSLQIALSCLYPDGQFKVDLSNPGYAP